MLLVLATSIAIAFIIIAVYLQIINRRLNAKLKYVDEANLWHKLAVTDDLTEVYNRNAYNMNVDKITEHINQGLSGIILFDIDDFKMINDTKGHLAGDEILIKTARILFEVFPEPKYRVFRIGGDEFAVLSKNASEHEIIRRLLSLKRRLKEDGNISLSKGYSIIKDTPEEAFRYADEMLYADKQSKKIPS